MALTVNFALSPFIIALFAAVMGPVIWYSGFPHSFFGLQTSNWRSALSFSVLVSLAFLAVAAGLKLLLIHTTKTFADLSLFGVADVREDMHQVMMSPLYWIAVGLYLALTPIQEFVARCCLQAPLHAFLPQRNAVLASFLVDPGFEPGIRRGAFAYQLRLCHGGLFTGAVLGLDFRADKFAHRIRGLAFHHRRRGHLSVRDRRDGRPADGLKPGNRR